MKDLEDQQYKEMLLKYSEAFLLKKKKSRNESELSDHNKRYVIYARKSTEDDKRQVQSIEDQIENCQRYAKNNNLEIVDIIREEKSAKIAGKREKFSMMLARLYKGDLYNAVLSWHPDRLARNMKEAGEILDMLDNEYIADLQFPSYSFNNDAAGKMTLSILFSMAKEFSDKLAEDTKRGIRKKVSQGKYVGSNKKGYYSNEDDYFRKDEEKFQIYKQAWELYKSGKTQGDIIKFLKEQGEDADTNSMSIFFQDPFSAGIYCYGDQYVDLETVDKKFTPLVSPKEFIMLQKINRNTPRGWRNTDEFRPFNEFVLCKDCGNFMTSGLSKGKLGVRYLNVTCGNRRCKEKRRQANIKPVANTIRGEIILDFVINGINILVDKIDTNTYEKAKEQYFENGSLSIKTIKGEISVLRSKQTKLDTSYNNAKSKLYTVDKDNEPLIKSISNDITIMLKEKNQIESAIGTLELKIKEIEYDMESEFPDYDTFLNFFKDLTSTLESTDDAYLVDQLSKLVFLNTTASEKNIVGYTFQETFSAFEGLDSYLGSVMGRRSNLFDHFL